jgi:hypothetical protein
MRHAAILAVLAVVSIVSAQTAGPKTYPLQTWKNMGCRAKGRFQDREYCGSKIIDQIVADGKSSIPILISQITDSRWIEEPVYDYWPRIRTGELAYFILDDLFLNNTWTARTIPPLSTPEPKCEADSATCWGNFRKTHSLATLQAAWLKFWDANKDRIHWDDKARCFRLK